MTITFTMDNVIYLSPVGLMTGHQDWQMKIFLLLATPLARDLKEG